MGSWDDDDDDDDEGLPDAAFTEDELAAGVQHIMRTGDPNATSSGRRPIHWDEPAYDMEDDQRTQDAHDVLSSRAAAPLRFETFAQARAWSQANPGKVFTRAADGRGFESKHLLPAPPVFRAQGVNSVQQGIEDYLQRSREIKTLAPLLHDVLSHSASNSYSVRMRPFDRRIWEDELSRLNTAQLSRLRLLVAVHLKNARERLRQLYAEMRRFPRSMKAGDYGEELTELLNEFMEKALKDIDKRLPASDDGNWDVPF
jgi:hypothetical protein